MDMTPESARSSMSPYSFKPSSQSSYEYPSPARSETHAPCKPLSPIGLGLYDCSLQSNSAADVQGSMPPTTTAMWHGSVLHARGGSQPTPNIFSEEYDPFAQFPQTIPSNYGHGMYTASAAPMATLPASPVPSCGESTRSSFSAPPSETYSQYSTQIKTESTVDWANSHGQSTLLSSPHPEPAILPISTNFSVCYEPASYYSNQQHQSWQKLSEKQSVEYSAGSKMSPDASSGGSRERRRSLGAVARTRQPRKLTTREEANFICHVDGCGKLFGRSYNYKAHLETHDSTRAYPFPCPVAECHKKFVRKTDLARHNQSVHMKQRNHQCSYCGRYFARKDTLRRHMEDGCSKRFDLGTVDFAPQEFSPRQPEPKDVPRSMAPHVDRRSSAAHIAAMGYSDSPTTMAASYLTSAVPATTAWPH